IAEVLRFRGGAGRSQAATGAIELLGEVGIRQPQLVARRYAHELSGGMRQRVMLAIALAARPQVLVAADRMALVWITHDIGVVAEISDTVAVMYGGRIVEHGPAQAIFEQPAHPYTRALVESPRRSRDAAPKQPFEAIPGAPPLGDFPAGCPFHPRCPHAMPVCAETMPAVTALTPGHVGACHLLGETAQASSNCWNSTTSTSTIAASA